LLALCSGNSSAAEVNALLSETHTIGTALYLPPHYTNALLAGFRTDTFAEAMYGRASNDLSLKRNLALIFGRLVGWESLCFLDDDIKDVNSKKLGHAATMLTKYSAVGFQVTNFPDNSVVRHAQRLGGIEPGVQSLSAGALVVDIAEVSAGFFPNIYNEDWFFLYDRLPTLFACGTVQQAPYDPFSNLVRAASEEFGDILAEGIIEMQAAGLDCRSANEMDWGDILAKRQRLLNAIAGSLEMSGAAEPKRKLALEALVAAKAMHRDITAVACRDYIRAWQQDAAQWQGRLSQLPTFLSVAEAARELQLHVDDYVAA
jgi:hypothetical protein